MDQYFKTMCEQDPTLESRSLELHKKIVKRMNEILSKDGAPPAGESNSGMPPVDTERDPFD